MAREFKQDRLKELARRAGAKGKLTRARLAAMGARQLDKRTQCVFGLLRQHRGSFAMRCGLAQPCGQGLRAPTTMRLAQKVHTAG